MYNDLEYSFTKFNLFIILEQNSKTTFNTPIIQASITYQEISIPSLHAWELKWFQIDIIYINHIRLIMLGRV